MGLVDGFGVVKVLIAGVKVLALVFGYFRACLYGVDGHGAPSLRHGLSSQPLTYLPNLPSCYTSTQFGGFGELARLDHAPQRRC